VKRRPAPLYEPLPGVPPGGVDVAVR
jgi:hypothetical protein